MMMLLIMMLIMKAMIFCSFFSLTLVIHPYVFSPFFRMERTCEHWQAVQTALESCYLPIFMALSLLWLLGILLLFLATSSA